MPPDPVRAPIPGPDGTVVGLLLAGGRSRRMGGGDKCLRLLAGRTILERIVERIAPQVGRLVLNANGNPARFPAQFDVGRNMPVVAPVVADVIDGFAGPLAGVLTGLEWTAAHAPDCPWVASVATDAPFLPLDLVARLCAAVRDRGADMACATSGGRSHPVIGLWPIRLAGDLRRAMRDEGLRKVDVWTARHRLAEVAFEAEPGGPDPFFNTNRPEDLELAEARSSTENLERFSRS